MAAAMTSADFNTALKELQDLEGTGSDDFYLTDQTGAERWKYDPVTTDFVKYNEKGEEEVRVTKDMDAYRNTQTALYRKNIQEAEGYEWKSQTLETPSVTQLTPEAQAKKDKEFKDLKTQAREEAQKKAAKQDFGVMAGLNLASLVFDAFPPKYIREKRKEAEKGVDEKEIAGKVQELTDKTTRTTKEASRAIQRGYESRQAAQGGITSAQQALTGAKAATQATIESLQDIPLAAGQYYEQLRDKAQAKVDDARQAGYVYTMGQRDKWNQAMQNINIAYARVKGPSSVQMNTAAMRVLYDAAPDDLSNDDILDIWEAAGGSSDKEEIRASYYKTMGKYPDSKYVDAMIEAANI